MLIINSDLHIQHTGKCWNFYNLKTVVVTKTCWKLQYILLYIIKKNIQQQWTYSRVEPSHSPRGPKNTNKQKSLGCCSFFVSNQIPIFRRFTKMQIQPQTIKPTWNQHKKEQRGKITRFNPPYHGRLKKLGTSAVRRTNNPRFTFRTVPDINEFKLRKY